MIFFQSYNTPLTPLTPLGNLNHHSLHHHIYHLISLHNHSRPSFNLHKHWRGCCPSQLPPPFAASIDSNHLSVHLMSSDSARYQRSACRTCLFPAPLAQMHHTAIAFSQQSPVLAYSLHSSSKHQSASIIPSHSVFKSGGSKHAQ